MDERSRMIVLAALSYLRANVDDANAAMECGEQGKIVIHGRKADVLTTQEIGAVIQQFWVMGS